MQSATATSVATTASASRDGRHDRGEETRRKVIRAARARIADGREVTVAGTAKWADVSKRNVFQHYRTAEDLRSVVRAKILYELVDDLVVIQELEGHTLKARVLDALEELGQIYLKSAQAESCILWAFSDLFSSDEGSAEAEELFQDKLQSLVSKMLREETRNFTPAAAQIYSNLRMVLGLQLSPRSLITLFDSVSMLAIQNMVTFTIREFLHVAKKTA